MSGERSLADRARLHAALGDPTRLAIVDRLQLGDASPGELIARLGMGTNLLAHHLKVLEAAGLVERVQSEGDRRRTYVRLLAPELPFLPATSRVAARVLFVCTHNSARSQLAVAVWRRGSVVPAACAGTHPAARVHPRAVAAARRHGFRFGRAIPVHIDAVLEEGDLVVAVCDSAYEQLGGPEELDANDLNGRRLERLHWSIPDPVRIDTDTAFDNALQLIESKISRLSAAVIASEETTP